MTGYAWAAVGMITAGAAIYAADKYLADRIRHAIEVRRFRRDMDCHFDALARIQDKIAETERRLRDCYGEDGDT